MENQQSTDFLSNLEVDHVVGTNFKETIKWTNFVSIVLIILLSLSALAMLITGIYAMGSAMQSSVFDTAFGGLGSAIFFLILPIIGVFIYGSTQLYRFGSQMRTAINNRDQLAFNSALRGLRNYFIVFGVISILMLLVRLVQMVF